MKQRFEARQHALSQPRLGRCVHGEHWCVAVVCHGWTIPHHGL
jgi:hypothetical protein